MPLIDLKSNLKSLKFGNDQPGYGSSGLPYIQTQIPGDPTSTGTFSSIYRAGSTGGLDFPIRGGAIDFSIGSQTFTVSSKIDKTRIKKFFEDKPRGAAFLQKQIGLQLSNPKIETGNTLYSLAQTSPLPGLLENTRVYNNGINTLAQVGVSGTGAHAVRHGTLPFNPLQKNYYSIVNEQNVLGDIQGTNQNRLIILSKLKMTSGTSQIVNTNDVLDINRVNTLGISLNRNIIFQYLGGPGSVYGVGTTTIPRAVDTTRLRSSRVMNYDQLMSQTINSENKGGANIQDFRTQLDQYNPPYNWIKEDTIDFKFYTSPGSYKDRMNLLGPFVFNNSTAPWEVESEKNNTKDIIKFVFEAISNDNPSRSTAIFFRAFLNSGITDNNSAQLNSFKYLGRGENFYTYQGFDRSISFGFRIAVQSEAELMPLYTKLNELMGQVYPDYSPNQGIMRAPIVRVTVGDYLYRVPGFLESVNVTVDNSYPWEINLQQSPYIGLAGDVAQLPQVLDISISFKPIMDVLPKRGGKLIVNDPKSVRPANEVNGQGDTLSGPLAVVNTQNETNPLVPTTMKTSISNPVLNPQQVKKAEASKPPKKPAPPKKEPTQSNSQSSMLLAPKKIEPITFNRGF